jgi:hypothetical protein
MLIPVRVKPIRRLGCGNQPDGANQRQSVASQTNNCYPVKSKPMRRVGCGSQLDGVKQRQAVESQTAMTSERRISPSHNTWECCSFWLSVCNVISCIVVPREPRTMIPGTADFERNKCLQQNHAACWHCRFVASLRRWLTLIGHMINGTSSTYVKRVYIYGWMFA